MNPAETIISVLDLTSLNDTDTDETIKKVCARAHEHYPVAAVCVYPQFIPLIAKELKGTSIKLATVANFPHGTDTLLNTQKSIEASIAAGADEIDVVMPYSSFLDRDLKKTFEYLEGYRKACGDTTLKIILETGAIKEYELIYQASCLAIDAGAQFIKTSTGKISVGATLDAAESMLTAIKNSFMPVGFKASGGIRTLEQAKQYIDLATTIMGASWVSPDTFRIGSSVVISA